jgi:uncharacterized protein
MSQKIIYNISDLVFGVTEDCCLRCAYCVYSGKYYIGERNHNETRMTIEVARKAMDLFFNYINRSSRTFKKKVIPIGFYGGEPFLEFDLIKKIIDYKEKRIVELQLQEKFEFKVDPFVKTKINKS